MSTSTDRAAAAEKEKGTHAAGAVAGGSKPPPRRTSESPAPRRGRSLIRGGGSEIVVRERVIRDGGGNAQYPTLTRTNYAEWAMVMRVQLQTAHLWDVIEYGADFRELKFRI
ncbi:hypothetical protein QYE76_010967 [Lolium multiflorum]|uniref:DUF4219 domain-containing protein n=1 Tax=Lolium multiflorum TaxID=4521 RepID=A0AAD8TUI7_LOLMU|nr:hypothetical protein QYE76_010967 [Lolium multiflorum]